MVREQAAAIVADVGPAALEIIAEFRAAKWLRIADRWADDQPNLRKAALIRSAEWDRIARSVARLLT